MTIKARGPSLLVSMCITASYCDCLTLRSAVMRLSQAALCAEVRHKVVFA